MTTSAAVKGSTAAANTVLMLIVTFRHVNCSFEPTAVAIPDDGGTAVAAVATTTVSVFSREGSGRLERCRQQFFVVVFGLWSAEYRSLVCFLFCLVDLSMICVCAP